MNTKNPALSETSLREQHSVSSRIQRYSEVFGTPLTDNPERPLQRSNPNALQDELIRHLNEDGKMSAFNFGVQFLDANNMTYWGKKHGSDFWAENASIEWKESEAPFHLVARLTLLVNSQLPQAAADAAYFDVTGHATPDSTPVGSINRARWLGEVASKKSRTRLERSSIPLGPD
jgi:hypothetical protein